MVIRKEDEARTIESLQGELANAKKEFLEYPIKIAHLKKTIIRGERQKELWTKIHPILVEGCNVVKEHARLQFELDGEFRLLNKEMQVLKNEGEMMKLTEELKNLSRMMSGAESEVEKYSRRIPELEEVIASKQ